MYQEQSDLEPQLFELNGFGDECSIDRTAPAEIARATEQQCDNTRLQAVCVSQDINSFCSIYQVEVRDDQIEAGCVEEIKGSSTGVGFFDRIAPAAEKSADFSARDDLALNQ
jgi:hypothetical protein